MSRVPPTLRLVRRCLRNMIIGQVGLALLFTFVAHVPFYAAMLFGVCVGVGAIDLAERKEFKLIVKEKRRGHR